MPQYDIEVTDEHIKNGDRMDTTACPIALAINDGLEEAENAFADMGFRSLALYPKGYQGGPRLLMASEEVAWWVSDFDAGHDVEPVWLRVDTDAETIERVDETLP